MKRILIALSAVIGALTLTAGGLALAASHHQRTHTALRTAAAQRHPASAYKAPAIHHVWIIILENESESVSFGKSSPAPYLAKTLVKEGVFLKNYYSTGHASNDNYISMISGQPPNIENQADCQSFDNFLTPGTTSYGAEIGLGCVYPSKVQNIATQLDAHHDSWRDYNQDMDNDPARDETDVCSHPPVGKSDPSQADTPTQHYATRHNPFVYFHAIIDNKTLCDSHVVNLNDLPGDLKTASKTPNYSFITPDLCGDGHDATGPDCKPGGLEGINDFLKQWVPKITKSKAFTQQHGLLFITFDEASDSDTSSCCGEIPGTGSPFPGLTGKGGGLVGAVAISPCIKPGTVSKVDYNHYTMLGSMENLFHLPHIGYAQLPKETYFGKDIFSNPSCKPPKKKKT